MKPDYHIVSFSGGKDSTAMLLHMVELGMQIDEILFCDTGLEFPSMYDHIAKVEEYIGRKITRVKAEHDFEYYFLEYVPASVKEIEYHGYGWATPIVRWCTTELKDKPRAKHMREIKGKYTPIEYIGIAADEVKRLDRPRNQKKNHRHPLVDWNWTEAECLKYCYDRGFDWGGLYKYFSRVSCWCCPMTRMGNLRRLRRHFPELWQKLRDWDLKVENKHHQFKLGYTMEQLEAKFAKEDLQGGLFDE